MSRLPAPRQVSPLIRLARYTFFISGIMYGSSRYHSLMKKEEEIQKRENVIKAKRKERMDREKAVRDKAQMDELAVEIGMSKQ